MASVEEELSKLEPDLSTRIRAVLDGGSGKLRLKSGYRDDAEQKVLWDRWQTGLKANGGSRTRAIDAGYIPANPPGRSKHGIMHNGKPAAEACDVECAWTDNQLRVDLFHENGLLTPISGEPWHAEKNPKWQRPAEQPPTQEDDDMRPLTALSRFAPAPARWVFVPETQELRALGGAQFYGNILDLPERDRPDSVFGLEALGDRDGYMLMGWKNGTPDWYGAFDAQWWADHEKLK